MMMCLCRGLVGLFVCLSGVWWHGEEGVGWGIGGRDFFGKVVDVSSVPRPGAWEKEDAEDEGFKAE